MKLRFMLAGAAVLVVSAPVMAVDKNQGQKDQSQDAPKEKKICRNETVTGSLVAQRRICMTQAEWDKLAEETKRDVEDIQRNSNAIPHAAGGNGSSAAAQ